MVDKEFGEYIKEMKIYDKSKELSPFHLKRESVKNIRMIYSDHNPIVVRTDLVMMQIQTNEKKKKTVMTEEGIKKYTEGLQKKEISKLWDDVKDIQETYKQWSTEVMEARTKNEQIRKPTTKRRSKTMRLLMKEKKKIKNELAKEKTRQDRRKGEIKSAERTSNES